MVKPEHAAFGLSLRPPFRPSAVHVNRRHLAVAALGLLGIVGVVTYAMRLFGAWGDRHAWAYPAAMMMVLLSSVATAPLLAFASRATRGYWGLPARRAAELFIIPSLLVYALLIPVLATLPPLQGRANLWFNFGGGAPFVPEALAMAVFLLTGLALLWVSAVPDVAPPPSELRLLPAWKRALYLNWSGTRRQWQALRAAIKVLGAFYLMLYVFVQMILSTDIGQSLLPGWRSGVFPVYCAVSGIQSGLAVTVITIALLKKYSALGRFIGDEQAVSIGKIMLGTTLMWIYNFWSDFMLVWYARLPGEVAAIQVLVAIVYKASFLVALFGMFLIPFVGLIFNPIRRRLMRLRWIAVSILVGLVFDRIRLFVPSMTSADPFGHYEGGPLPGPVWPNAVDVLFILGWIALVALAYLWAASRVPMLVGWEMREAALLRREAPFVRGHVLILGKPD